MTRKKPPANPVLPVQPDRKGHVHLFLKNANGVWTCDCGATK